MNKGSTHRDRRVLRAEGVYKAYPSGSERIEVLKGVDLEIAAGAFVSIQGESGVGKSTLLNVLAGLESADAGEVYWGGDAIHAVAPNNTRLGRARARGLGFVFQSYYLVPELNARENVVIAGRLLGGPLKALEERADHLLTRLGVAHRSRGLPSQLSGGERQRVAIARALLNRPGLIIADEPTGNLDERTGEEVIDLLLEVCSEENTACLLVTHNRAFAARTGSRLKMAHGRLHSVE